MKIDGDKALQNAFRIKPMHRYPGLQDQQRSRDGLLFPSLKPSFSLSRGARVFTLGSCFARNVEEVLAGEFELPAMRFKAPKTEWKFRPNGLLNEYNPAAMSQRLLWAANGQNIADMDCALAGSDDDCIDLLLAGGSAVTRSRALERRREIDQIYADLPGSEVLILTLGMTECWYDTEQKVHLNRGPLPAMVRAEPKRYRFERLDVGESYLMLEKGIDAALSAGLKRVLLTVSPVPLQSTFSGDDCVIANQFSKSVLRIVADRLRRRFVGRLDYFPSYEIALSGGLSAFGDDHVHVRPDIVRQIVEYLCASYIKSDRV